MINKNDWSYCSAYFLITFAIYSKHTSTFMQKSIYLIRHTTPNVAKGVCYGFTDIEVAESFPDDLCNVREKLQNITFSHFYSSPSIRCRQLAENLHADKITFDERLKELNFGQMEMVPYDEMDKEWLNRWMNDFVNVKCPAGESFLELQTRVIDFYQELLQKDESTIGIATHGGVIRSLICHILKIPLQNAFKIVFDWGGISKISINDSLVKIDFINR